MKKLLVTILAFIYLGVSSGVAMNVHYCMGKISSVDLIQGKDKCGKCGMKKGNSGCCKDVFKIIKLSDAHKLISNEVSFFSPATVLPRYYAYDTGILSSNLNSLVYNNSPPAFTGVPLNILHCVFRV